MVVEVWTIKVCLQSMVPSLPPEHHGSFASNLDIADSLYGLRKNCFVVPLTAKEILHHLEQLFLLPFLKKIFHLTLSKPLSSTFIQGI